jgi:nitrite reductase/ring-hydroxylating ferredoxin subunit
VPRLRIARTDEIPPGETRFFCVEGRSVVIAEYDGGFHALDGICPHKGMELDHARLAGDAIECPWHRYQYDVRTGENLFPSRVYAGDISRPADPLATYRVDVADGEIWVELP